MPADSLKPLMRSLLDEIATLTDGLVGGQLDPVAWHNAVARELFAHHLAAYADAADKPPEDVLEQVKKIVGGQVTYLNGFTDAIEAGDYEDRTEALQARAVLYAEPLRFTMVRGNWGEWDIPGELMPGSQPCGGRCGCTISISDNGDGTGVLTRVLGGGAHCEECPALEGDHVVERLGA